MEMMAAANRTGVELCATYRCPICVESKETRSRRNAAVIVVSTLTALMAQPAPSFEVAVIKPALPAAERNALMVGQDAEDRNDY
jgi:hypothetical protein